MRFFENSKIMLVVFLCVSISTVLNAEILWEKDLALDANTNSAPLASCLNKDANGLIVMTVECPKGSFPIHGNGILWEIGTNGETHRFSPKNIDGSIVQTNSNPIGPGCVMASDNFGNLLTIGLLGKQKAGVISGDEKTEKTVLPLKQIESRSVKKLISLQDNTFILVGDRGGDGLCLRVNSQGDIVQEKLFDIGGREILTGVDVVKSNNSNLAVVGLSPNISIENPVENSAENFILIYNSDLKIVHEDYFTEGFPGLLLPKVCCLDNGNIIVVYKKKSEHAKAQLWARCYTQELKLLWEKEIFVADKLPFSFDVTSCGSAGFVIGVVLQLDGLEFYSFDKDGKKTGYTLYEGMVGISGFNLMCLNNKAIAIFKEGTAGNINECTIKAKAIALD